MNHQPNHPAKHMKHLMQPSGRGAACGAQGINVSQLRSKAWMQFNTDLEGHGRSPELICPRCAAKR